MAQFENPFFGVLYISNSDPQFLLKSVLTMYSNNFILENYSAVQKLQIEEKIHFSIHYRNIITDE